MTISLPQNSRAATALGAEDFATRLNGLIQSIGTEVAGYVLHSHELLQEAYTQLGRTETELAILRRDRWLVPKVVTTETPWRDIGPIHYADWSQRLRGTPLEPYTVRMYDAAGPYSALILALLWRESSFGRGALSASGNNPLALTPYHPDQPTVDYLGTPFRRFDSPVEAVEDAVYRFTDTEYKAGVYVRTHTLQDLVDTYVGEDPASNRHYATKAAQFITDLRRTP